MATQPMNEQAGAGMEGEGVDQPSRGGQQAGGAPQGLPPGVDQEQADLLKRITVLAQTVLADEQGGAQVIEQASQGQSGMIGAVIGILHMVIEKMDIGEEMLIPAGVAIMSIIYKFLGDIGRAKADPKEFGAMTGALAGAIAQQFNLPKELVAEQMVGQQGGTPQQAPDRSAMGAIGQMMGGA